MAALGGAVFVLPWGARGGVMFKELVVERLEWERHEADIAYLSNNLRAADAKEMAACGYVSFGDMLRCFMKAEGLCLLVRGAEKRPLCLFGLGEDYGDFGRLVWFMGTDELMAYKREFLHYSALIVTGWLRDFGRLFNAVAVGNRKAVLWLRWLGAEFSSPFEMNRELFMWFWLERRFCAECKEGSGV